MNRLHRFDVLVAWFREYMTVNNFRPRTVQTYHFELSLFRRWLFDKTELEDIDGLTAEVLRGYAASLYDRGLCAKTIRSKLAALKSFFSAAYEYKKLYADYRGYLQAPAVNKTLPADIPTEAETKRVFEYLENATDGLRIETAADAALVRDRAIFEVLYSTGMRRNELIGLTTAAVDYENGLVFIRQGKGGKDRVVPIGKTALAAVQRYVAEARPVLAAKSCNNLFVNRKRGLKLDENTIRRSVNAVVKAAGLTKHVRIHGIRHACATHLLNAGADIRYVQELLGHSCLTSTQLYTHLSITKLKETHARHHPREKGSMGHTDQGAP